MESKRNKKSTKGSLFLMLLISVLVVSFQPSKIFADVIIDNGDSGTSSTGTWQTSGAPNPYGVNSLWSRNGATYTWGFGSQPSGLYEVLMWWSGWPSRGTAIDVTIDYLGAEDTISINQQENDGLWNSLGTYSFDSSGSVTITAADGATISTCADAVWFRLISENSPPTAIIDSIVPNPADPAQAIQFTGHGLDSDGSIVAYNWESSIDGSISSANTFITDSLSEGVHTISLTVQDDQGTWSEAATDVLIVGSVPVETIIDNLDSNTSQTGTWVVSEGADPYLADSVWSRDGATFTWIFTPPETGDYEVSMWWTAWSSRSVSAEVQIENIGGTDTVFINQQQNGGQWNTMGTYSFDTGIVGSVTIIAEAASPTSYCADAVKFSLVDTNNTPTAIIDSITPNPADYGVLVSFNGHGDDTDGTIAAYNWESSIDGNLSDLSAFSTNLLSEGQHVISFTVQDNEGKWSTAATENLVIGNIAPIAYIDSITPNPAAIGELVTCSGHGEDQDGTITGYSWVSSIDGNLSDALSFSTDTLSEGDHIITLTVYDNEGKPSDPVSQNLGVHEPVTDMIIDNGDPDTGYTGTWSASGGLNPYLGDSDWSRDGTTYTWTFYPAVTGLYELSMWWTEYASRSSFIPVEIEYTGGPTTVNINQQQNGGQWNILGQYLFESGSGYNVAITSQPGPTTTCADAVRFVLQLGGNIPPVATIDSITPNPAQPGENVTFTGHGTDNDGTIEDYNWRSSMDGFLSNASVFSSSSLSAGTHTIYFSVKDDQESWSPEVSATFSTGQEHIYVSYTYNWEKLIIQYEDMLVDIGATYQGGAWRYTNQAQGQDYIIHFVDDVEGTRDALMTEGAHVILAGHSNYGMGPSFSTPAELSRQVIEDIEYVDDDRIWAISTPFARINIRYLRTGQAYPYFWPEFQDGTSAIMPYDFGDPRGAPGYNYYITYQVPGDPNHYKIESVRNSAVERFSDSRRPAWYSIDGAVPDPNNPDHRKYFITNTAPWSPSFETVGNWQQEQLDPGEDGDYYRENYIYNFAGQGNDKATWLFSIPEAGNYKIFGWWPALSSNSPDAPYTISHSAGETTIDIDQRINGQQWYEIGEVYFEPNDYSVVLTDDASSGNVVADGLRIAHADNPPEIVTADFGANTRYGEAPLLVTFYNTSKGDLTNRTWNFGDGQTNNTRDYIDHTFMSPGTYTISLSVSGPTGSDSKTRIGYITVVTTESQPPLQAEFSTWSSSGKVPLTVRFTDSSYGDLREGITYTPAPGFTGVDTFTYTVADNEGALSNEATVTVTVSDGNLSPAATDDPANTKPETAVTIDIVANDVDFDGTIDQNSITVTSGPSDGGAVINGDGTVTYTPDAGFGGIDTFNYTVLDNEGAVSNEATVTVTVNAANISPVANNDSAYTKPETTETIVVIANDIDPDGTIDPNSITVTSGPSDGGIVVNGDGTVSYTSDAGFSGTDTFNYTVLDNEGGLSNEATVTVTVSAVNLPPVANDDSAYTRTTAEVTVDVSANDRDNDGSIAPGTIVVTSGPSNGAVTVHDAWLWDFGDGQSSHESRPRHTYTELGNYTVSLTVTDSSGDSDSETKENYVRVLVFEKSIDNVDYPKRHYGSMNLVSRKEMELDVNQMKYTRMLYDSCNSGNYYLGTFHRGVTFYTLANSGSRASVLYLKAYMEGKTDEEIWEIIQNFEPAYDYYNFNEKPPSPDEPVTQSVFQSTSSTLATLSSVDTLSPAKIAKVQALEGQTTEQFFDRLQEVDFVSDDALLQKAISSVLTDDKRKEIIATALNSIKSPSTAIIDDQVVNQGSDVYVAKKILKVFSEESVDLLVKLYENGDITTKGNVIRAAGELVSNPAIKNLLIAALDNKIFVEDDDPEATGSYLRICDLAYNQLVLHLKIKGVLRTVGTVHSTEVRDYHIDILKGML